MKDIVVYVAGPYQATTPEEVQQNIRRAVELASKLRQKGYCCIVPHLESMLNERAISEDEWLEHGKCLLLRCDAVVLVEGWENSNGTFMEIGLAGYNDIPVFQSIEELEVWRGLKPPQRVSPQRLKNWNRCLNKLKKDLSSSTNEFIEEMRIMALKTAELANITWLS